MSAIFSKKTINCNGEILDLETPIVMGILNLTPDSFYSESRYSTEKQIIERVQTIISEGAKIIDIGAYSSRPNAIDISENEELERLEFGLKIINQNFKNVIISVDTFRSKIAYKVVQNYGVAIINDISAGELDNKMFETVSKLNTPYIMMHLKGKPQTMQNNCDYKNIFKEMVLYFAEKINKLKHLGINDIIIDPGFGFSKNIQQNYEILNLLDNFRIFGLPILIGISRKSMIYKLLDTLPENSLNGSTVLNTIALQKGASILRVHDVKEAIETIKIVNYFNKNKNDIS